MRRKYLMAGTAAVFVWLALAPGPAAAAGENPAAVVQSPAGPLLTLLRVEERVRGNNPDIRAALAKARAARAAAVSSAAWPGPGLGIAYSDFPRPGLSPVDAERKSLDISQELPFPGKTFLAMRTAGADADKAEARARETIQENVYMARQAYWNLVVAVESSQYLERARESLAGMAALSGKRNRFGRGGRMEQLMDPMVRMELAALKVRILDLEQERRSAALELNVLMGADPGEELGAPEPAAPPETRELVDTAWLKTGLDDSPSVAVARRDLKLMRARRDQALAGWLPDFMLQYSAVDMKDGGRAGMAMVKVSLPMVWFWRPAAAGVAAAGEARASEAMLEQARLEVRRLALEELSHLAILRNQLAIFDEEILPQAAKALELAISGFQSGSIGPADALTSVRSYISMNIERTMLVAQIGRSAAVLSRLKGP